MKLAIVIGVSEYQYDDFGNLPACKNDAELFKDVVSDVSNIDDLLYINASPKAFDAKKQLSEFVQKHKGKTIDELVFYFSGHGGRYEDDFFYIFTDFKESKKESTGLRNTELDGFVRTLKPKLFVKIVDACFSGTQYIKAEANTRSELEKSAKDNQLNDIYFMFSSRDDRTSLAGPEFSKFTESLFTGLLDHTGDIRYRDLAAYIADDFNSNGLPKPIFISQADLVENFGVVTDNTQKLILKAFGLTEKPKEVDVQQPITTEPPAASSLVELVKKKADSDYCDKDTAMTRLAHLKDGFQGNNWPKDIVGIFEISVHQNIGPHSIPNCLRIGIWINENKSKDFFAVPTYKEDIYEVEEYKALPKKPSSSRYSSIAALAMASSRLFGEHDDTEYKLEKIKKRRQLVDGFSYSFENENNVLKLTLEPKYISVKPIVAYIVCLYSKTDLAIQYSYEFLKSTNWETRAHPICENWKVKKIKLKNEASISGAKDEIIKEISDWAIAEISKTL